MTPRAPEHQVPISSSDRRSTVASVGLSVLVLGGLIVAFAGVAAAMVRLALGLVGGG